MNKSKLNSKNIYITVVVMIVLELIVKCLGFIKQSFVAYYYGAGKEMDIYFIASDFINGFSNAIINSARIAVIGVYTSVRIKEGVSEGQKLISVILKTIVPVSLLVMLFFCLSSKQIGTVLAPAFSGTDILRLSKYLRILSGVILLSMVCMILESVLNSNEIYGISKLRSFIYSVSIILGCVLFSKNNGVIVLVICQFVTLIIYLFSQVICARKIYKFSWIKGIDEKSKQNIKYILRMMLPVVVGNSVVQINYMVDNAVGSSLEEGSVSALAYGHVLDEFFVAVIITSVTSILFPHFTKLIAEGKNREVSTTLINSLEIMVLLLIPVSVFCFFSTNELVGLVFQRGSFDQSAANLTSIALQGYVIRYPFVAIRDIFVQGLYAQKDTKTPMINALLATLVNICISVGFARIFGIIAISIGTTISAIFGMILNFVAIRKVFRDIPYRTVFIIMLKSILFVGICVVMLIAKQEYLIVNSLILDLLLNFIIVCMVYYGGFILIQDKEVKRLLHQLMVVVKGRIKR